MTRLTASIAAGACLFAVMILGCVGGALLERGIAARGGALESWTREAEVRVYQEFSGVWNWAMAFRAPGRFRFTIETAGPDQHYVFDGRTLRTFIGGVEIAETEGPEALAFASLARWMAVITLDPLRSIEGLEIEELAEAGIPSRATRWLRVGFPDGALYRLGFDSADRLVTASGPIAIPGIGDGVFAARFEDFRRVAGFVLPFATRYSLNGEPLFDERVTRFAPLEPTLQGDEFRMPQGGR